MSVNNVETTSVLLKAAQNLLDSDARRLSPTDLRFLQLLLGPESRGARAFLNHKFLWPKHVRPIERWLGADNQSMFSLTAKERIIINELKALLRPPP
jgi:hypothetical protein